MRNPPLTPGQEPATASWRVHLPFLAVFSVGVVLRVLVQLAYRPALLFPDSHGYLDRAQTLKLSPDHPGGYSFFLWPVVHLTSRIWVLATLNHLLGLGLAVAIYLFCRSRGLPGWGATLAVVPVLLDPLQLCLEQYVLSDVLFEVLITGGCLLLVARRRLGPWAAFGAGLAAGAGAVVRGAGQLVVLLFVVLAIALCRRWLAVLAVLVGAALPTVAYAVDYHSQKGVYSLGGGGPNILWSRLAPVVECAHLKVPAYEQSLCPRQPVSERPSVDWYMWGGRHSAQYHLHLPPGLTTTAVLRDFDRRVVRAEPLVLVKASAVDFARGFRFFRSEGSPGFPAKHWLFQAHYWSLDHFSKRKWDPSILAQRGYSKPLARFFTGYRRVFYVPGPLLGALLVVALVAAAGVGTSRWSGKRLAITALAGTCLATLLMTAVLAGASWRYQLPQLSLIPPAAALAFAAFRTSGPAPRTRRLLAPRWVAPAAVGAAVLVWAALMGSGWVRPVNAAVVGVGAGVVAAGCLLRARRVVAPVTPVAAAAPMPLVASGDAHERGD
jgi:hypothetical protein